MKDKTLTLEELGWSQDDVSRIIGVTRPAYKKHLLGEGNLSIEQSYKLSAIESLQVTRKQFVKSAVEEYTAREILAKAHRNLSEFYKTQPNAKEAFGMKIGVSDKVPENGIRFDHPDGRSEGFVLSDTKEGE